jgi:hypothetical protein
MILGLPASRSWCQDAASEADVPVLQLTPAKEPSPALKYRFWPSQFELEPGNAFVRFQRAVLLMVEAEQQQPQGEESLWLKYESVEAIPPEEIRSHLADFESALSEVRAGARLAEADYELGIDRLRGAEVVEFLLPEFQRMRGLARLLDLKVRLALAENRVEDAIETIRVGLRLGEATNQAADLLITRLVGLAINGIMLGDIEQVMERSDSPNLYWALATIPESAWEITPAVQFEASILDRVFPGLTQLPEDSADPAFWRRQVQEILSGLRGVQGGEDESEGSLAQTKLLAGFAIVGLAESSRNQLIAAGFDPDKVKGMTPAEAVVRATRRAMREVQDDLSKWAYLPRSLMDVRGEKLERSGDFQQRLADQQILADFATVLAGLLMPAVNAAERAGLRTQQQVYRLITIEAIRDHVARTGALPDSLDELEVLPAWPDPFTGEHFGYRKLSDSRAEMTKTPSYSNDPNTTVILQFDLN